MHIRNATPTDRDAILALVPRLADHGTPFGRNHDAIVAVDIQTVANAIEQRDTEVEVLVAEDESGIVGFVHVRTVIDYYTQAPIGHVSDIVVAEGTEGRGVGRALIAAAQDWACGKGYRMMQLYVLPENVSARALYERMGYRVEWIKLVSPLGPKGDGAD
ncbi:GNAT family N-acetyltransferase [Luteimonas sp. SDU101]|uniref:GNAT family N-acetyltransferase n=1 Tax=unclassified Luteimonas TaxID=2629088 RepID=UPI003EBF3996